VAGDTGDESDERPVGLVARLLGLPIRWLVGGVGALALAVSGLFGGLDPVPEEPPPTVAVGTVDAGEPWNVTITGARLLADMPPLKVEHPGDRWVAVLAIVEITADEPMAATDVIRLAGVPGLIQDHPSNVYLLRDTAELTQLQPGLPEKLAFFWEQSGSVPVPTEVTVEIVGRTHRADSLIEPRPGLVDRPAGKLQWFDPEVRARVTTPVQDRRNA
jgi:hypothetical protein